MLKLLTERQNILLRGASIPTKHACTGDDFSPPLRRGEVPKGTTSLALIMEDPDAPGGTVL